MKILIIDDETLDLFISKRILGSEFQIEGFTTLAEALEWAKNNPFDILVSDYYLSKGQHAMDVLKAMIDLKGKTFKAYVLTNYIDDGKITELKQAGYDGIIDKPIVMEKFKKAVGLQ
jgi:DNA-binding NarL/FixJ family response regulator